MPGANAPTGRPATLAALAAGIAIAQQVAGKAARDTLFLSRFPVTALPAMLVVSALVSMAAVLPASRALATHGPRRMVPLSFAGGAVAMALIALLEGSFPAAAAVALYLHVAVVGSLLISGFWSLVNESFDARTAKSHIGSIAAGGTLGGLIGGVAAERVSALAGMQAVLLLLVGLLGLAALLTSQMGAHAAGSLAAVSQSEPHPLEGVRTVLRVRYLRDVALLVGVLTVMAALLDYVFKARAAQAYQGHALLRFFALFYVATGVFAFLVQTLAARRSLERLGLARTVAVLPASVAAAAVAACAVPGLALAAVARGVEVVLRNSLFRSGFELFFTPIPPREKRASKAVADVGVERAGDALGGGLVRLVLLVLPAVALPALAALAALLGALAVGIALRLHRGYVEALEKNLALRAVQLNPDDVADRTTRETMLLSLTGIPLPVSPGSAVSAALPPGDEVLHAIAALRSGDAARIRPILAQPRLLEPATAAYVVPLLGRDDLANEAAAALRGRARRLCGQLVDALLDERESFAVRRRLPRVLAACPIQRAVDGLMEGLGDRRFEVRFQCGRALTRLHDSGPHLHLDPARLQEAVLREAQLDRATWDSQGLVSPGPGGRVGAGSGERHAKGERSLEHVFTLLALTMAREPLWLAYHGIGSPDAAMRGTALEYLETVLPPPVRTALWPLLAANPPAAAARPAGQVLEDLLRSGASMQIDLKALQSGPRAQPGGPGPGPGGGAGAAPPEEDAGFEDGL